MSKRRIAALVCALAVGLSAGAQRRDEFRVELGWAKPLDVGGFYFDAFEDGREESEVIGSAQIGLNNRRVSAVLDEPLKFSGFRTANMIVKPVKGTQPLTLRITDIQVDEHTTLASEEGIATVAGEVVYVSDSSDNRVIYRGEFTATKRGIGDVSAGLGNLIVEAMRDLIAEFAATNWRAAIEDGGVTTVTAPSHRGELEPGFPFAGVPDRALYVTSRDFAFNSPAQIPFRVVQRGESPRAS